MKKIILLLVLLIFGLLMNLKNSSAQVSVSFQVFYDDLSPYGYWVENSEYGYVWIPSVNYGFTPYGTNGYWVFTEFGWTWVSYYQWGWAPFHYGRWYYDSMYGYCWVPGNEWGPGWVTWRVSDGYYGWAAISPGISIDFAYSSGYRLPYNQWTFVGHRDFGSTNISNYYVSSSRNTEIINNSTVINNVQVDNTSNIKYNTGPKRTDVEKHTGKSIAPITIKERTKPGHDLSNNQLQIYKPNVKKNDSNDKKPSPSKITNLKDVKPVAKKNTVSTQQKANQSVKEKPSQQQKSGNTIKEKPTQQQKSGNTVKKKQTQQQKPINTIKEKPAQQQKSGNTVKEKPAQQNTRQNPAQQKQQNTRQQPKPQPQQNTKQQTQQKQNTRQQIQQKPQQQQTTKQSPHKPSQPQQSKPIQNPRIEKPKH
ncbi:MAG: hypothetical protein A2046_11015 [Bacteroidetes bacterium GWA2_30_7]|nr:MAG: hypothetical protein A2046_11015 [Bacteroidetes bacterium GWA2_30_7]